MSELNQSTKKRSQMRPILVLNSDKLRSWPAWAELNTYQIQKFEPDGFVDSFISSCFVHVRKPDAGVFRLALDIAHAPTRQVVYIENTPMFVRIAEGLGIRSILHTDYRSTCAKLASFGLQNAEGVIHETS